MERLFLVASNAGDAARARGAADKAGLLAKPECGRFDKPTIPQKLSLHCAGGKRAIDLISRQRSDGDCDAPLTEVALRVEVAGRRALDRRMAGKIHRICDQRRGGVGERGGRREDRNGVSDAKREAASPPA